MTTCEMSMKKLHECLYGTMTVQKRYEKMIKIINDYVIDKEENSPLKLNLIQVEKEEIANAVLEMRSVLQANGLRQRDYSNKTLIIMAINQWLIQECGKGLEK